MKGVALGLFHPLVQVSSSPGPPLHKYGSLSYKNTSVLHYLLHSTTARPNNRFQECRT